ncbi:MAG: hypothetical protein NXI10_00240 [bacterium]|nr:hypothetical protein [bacterium]
MRIAILLIVLTPILSFGQLRTFHCNDVGFKMKTEIISNEWGTLDTLQLVYFEEKEEGDPVFTFYSYQDQGGDCNNLFWMKETLTVEGNQLVLLSHRFQKTGIDPIPEWRKRIYSVKADNSLELIYDRYKYYESSDWVDE